MRCPCTQCTWCVVRCTYSGSLDDCHTNVCVCAPQNKVIEYIKYQPLIQQPANCTEISSCVQYFSILRITLIHFTSSLNLFEIEVPPPPSVSLCFCTNTVRVCLSRCRFFPLRISLDCLVCVPAYMCLWPACVSTMLFAAECIWLRCTLRSCDGVRVRACVCLFDSKWKF